MPDISMCTNILCKSKEFCYRFTATPSNFGQYYVSFNCKEDEYFIPNDKCNFCGQLNGVHKLSCSSKKIILHI